MTRILILIILVWILYFIIKRIATGINAKNRQPDTKENTEAKQEVSIVQCSNCGCHVPESESQIKDSKVICNNPECQK
jgi:hypothetical protein